MNRKLKKNHVYFKYKTWNIINVLHATFDQFNASFLNNSINAVKKSYWPHKLLNSSVQYIANISLSFWNIRTDI